MGSIFKLLTAITKVPKIPPIPMGIYNQIIFKVKNMLSKKILLISSVLALAALLGGCAPDLSPNTYSGGEVGVASRVVKGTVVSIRQVKIAQNSGVGAVGGAVAGGAAGSLIGGTTAVNIVGATGGAVVGGLIGNEVEKEMRKDVGYEYIIQLDNNSTISVTQQQDLQLSLQQRVLVIYGPTTRIVPDNTVSVPSTAPNKATTTKSPTTGTKS
ncbi:MAG: slyB [Gammaproteobacteria bacterium]|jgi:outer membrane lipoprotein SlyB|nr:slyB [Gammaproteobacteria bacterium]